MTLHEGLTRVIEDARDHSRKNFNVVKESYGQYLARAILTSDVIAQVKADAWGEGSETGFTHGMSYQAGNNSAMNYRNPYRKEQS